jgi:phosphatidylserine/phosphatidylglycerophosphate/cardiolipin synthase-like enzyme
MPRRSRRGSSLGTVIVLVVVIAFAVYYMQSGSDPLGLFKSMSEIATSVGGPITNTAVAALPQAGATNTPGAAAQPSFAGGTWWQVYFVNPLRLDESQELELRGKIPAQNYQGSIAEKLIGRIDAAQRTIHIASFETDLNDVANALVRAKERGVDVRWITDDEHGVEADKEPGHGQFKILKAAGIKVIDDERGGLMHNKFWLFDGQTVWTGSTNVTVSGMFEQDNNTVVIESSELAAIYEGQFEDMWNGNFNASSSSTVDQQSISIDGTRLQVLFSPEDNAVSHILPYVQNAQTSIAFLAFSYTQDDLGGAMIERKKNGVDVRGVFEATGSDTEFSEMIPLFCAKAQVRQDGNPSFLHHKVIIVDNRIVITGSLNFSENANEQNNENVIVIDNAEIAGLYTQEFQRIWAGGRDPEGISCK